MGVSENCEFTYLYDNLASDMLIGVLCVKTNCESCMGICSKYGHSPREPSVLPWVNNDHIIYNYQQVLESKQDSSLCMYIWLK